MKEFLSAWNGGEIFKASMVLFAVIDIIGSIPIIIKIKETSGDIRPGRITIVSLLMMVIFLVGGEGLLSLYGISVEAFAVAGSLILFALAIEMSTGLILFKDDASSQGKNAGMVPLAFPIIAGAGSMTTLIAIRTEYAMINILTAIIINIIIVFIVLKMTRRIEQVIGAGGIAILKKVFGIILMAISIKLFASNVTVLF